MVSPFAIVHGSDGERRFEPYGLRELNQSSNRPLEAAFDLLLVFGEEVCGLPVFALSRMPRPLHTARP
jgi:hypothetical protein